MSWQQPCKEASLCIMQEHTRYHLDMQQTHGTPERVYSQLMQVQLDWNLWAQSDPIWTHTQSTKPTGDLMSSLGPVGSGRPLGLRENAPSPLYLSHTQMDLGNLETTTNLSSLTTCLSSTSQEKRRYNWLTETVHDKSTCVTELLTSPLEYKRSSQATFKFSTPETKQSIEE